MTSKIKQGVKLFINRGVYDVRTVEGHIHHTHSKCAPGQMEDTVCYFY
jgi:hypothetical protein